MRNVLFLAALIGCSDTSSQVNITKQVDASGGTVSHTDGTSVQIPMGALSTTASITISSVNVSAPVGTVAVGPAYDFGPEGTTFAQPVTITLPFDTARIPSGRTSADVRIYTAARGSNEYMMTSTTLTGTTVKTATTHFTVYLPAVALPTDMASSGNCTPNCTSSTNSCGCTANCGGHAFQMSCSQSGASGPASCFCEIDSMTQSTSIVLDSCSTTQAQQAFVTQCLPN